MSQIVDQDFECPVCFESFNDENIRFLSTYSTDRISSHVCQHLMCNQCSETYFQNDNPLCPVCRVTINGNFSNEQLRRLMRIKREQYQNDQQHREEINQINQRLESLRRENERISESLHEIQETHQRYLEETRKCEIDHHQEIERLTEDHQHMIDLLQNESSQKDQEIINLRTNISDKEIELQNQELRIESISKEKEEISIRFNELNIQFRTIEENYSLMERQNSILNKKIEETKDLLLQKESQIQNLENKIKKESENENLNNNNNNNVDDWFEISSNSSTPSNSSSAISSSSTSSYYLLSSVASFGSYLFRSEKPKLDSLIDDVRTITNVHEDNSYTFPNHTPPTTCTTSTNSSTTTSSIHHLHLLHHRRRQQQQQQQYIIAESSNRHGTSILIQLITHSCPLHPLTPPPIDSTTSPSSPSSSSSSQHLLSILDTFSLSPFKESMILHQLIYLSSEGQRSEVQKYIIPFISLISHENKMYSPLPSDKTLSTFLSLSLSLTHSSSSSSSSTSTSTPSTSSTSTSSPPLLNRFSSNTSISSSLPSPSSSSLSPFSQSNKDKRNNNKQQQQQIVGSSNNNNNNNNNSNNNSNSNRRRKYIPKINEYSFYLVKKYNRSKSISLTELIHKRNKNQSYLSHHEIFLLFHSLCSSISFIHSAYVSHRSLSTDCIRVRVDQTSNLEYILDNDQSFFTIVDWSSASSTLDTSLGLPPTTTINYWPPELLHFFNPNFTSLTLSPTSTTTLTPVISTTLTPTISSSTISSPIGNSVNTNNWSTIASPPSSLYSNNLMTSESSPELTSELFELSLSGEDPSPIPHHHHNHRHRQQNSHLHHQNRSQSFQFSDYNLNGEDEEQRRIREEEIEIIDEMEEMNKIKEIDWKKVDIWSCGTILSQMICCSEVPLWYGENSTQILFRLLFLLSPSLFPIFQKNNIHRTPTTTTTTTTRTRTISANTITPSLTSSLFSFSSIPIEKIPIRYRKLISQLNPKYSQIFDTQKLSVINTPFSNNNNNNFGTDVTDSNCEEIVFENLIKIQPIWSKPDISTQKSQEELNELVKRLCLYILEISSFDRPNIEEVMKQGYLSPGTFIMNRKLLSDCVKFPDNNIQKLTERNLSNWVHKHLFPYLK